MSDIGQSIAGAVEYLTANPDKARYTDSSATAKVDWAPVHGLGAGWRHPRL